MTNKIDISRRRFIKWMGSAVILSFGGIWYSMVRRDIQTRGPVTKRIDEQLIKNGVTIFDDFLIIKNGNEIKVFSNKCTHLGCSINKVSGDMLVCPCHGSEFKTKDGSVVRGPASNRLKELEHSVSDHEILIKIV